MQTSQTAQDDKFYSGKLKQELSPSLRDRSQGKPSRDRKALRENKRQS